MQFLYRTSAIIYLRVIVRISCNGMCGALGTASSHRKDGAQGSCCFIRGRPPGYDVSALSQSAGGPGWVTRPFARKQFLQASVLGRTSYSTLGEPCPLLDESSEKRVQKSDSVASQILELRILLLHPRATQSRSSWNFSKSFTSTASFDS